MRKLLATAWLAVLGGASFVAFLSEPLTRTIMALILAVVITAWAVCEVFE